MFAVSPVTLPAVPEAAGQGGNLYQGRGHYDRGVTDRELTLEARIPAAARAGIEESVAAAAAQRVAERLREADATLWGGPDTPEVANRLGWLTIAERMLGELADVEEFAAEVRHAGMTDVVLLGMGGSSLAPEVLRRSFGDREGHPRLHVLDSTDAAAVRAVGDTVTPQRTLFVVSSKSGGTVEPLSLFAHFWSLVPNGANFTAITDPGSGLEKLAAEHGFRRTFAGDPDIGGRYSALSAFGIVPGALMGADVRALLGGARDAWDTPLTDLGGGSRTPVEVPAAVWLGCALSALVAQGRDKLTFLISPSLPGLGLWLEQLVAESTGKHGTGILPVADEPPGDARAYGEDRVFAYLPDLDAGDAELDARVLALAEAGHPVITIPTRGPGDLGRVFLLAELAVSVSGWGLHINPFDQPNVQQAKDATNSVLAGYQSEHRLPDVAEADESALASLLGDSHPPEYVAIMGYLSPSTAFDKAIGELRSAIRAATGATTTFGYGPRFLHSTGQFHKGGPRTGRFLQLIHDGPDDVDIPGAPYSFTTLKHAQAIGDLQTLRGLDLPARRLTLAGENPAAAVRALAGALGARAT
jgi:glucose-6-phosphate isomerase